MAKKSIRHRTARPAGRDSAGWGFWLIAFAVLYAPSWYLAYQFTVDYEKKGRVPWMTAFALAALGAGLLSVTVNYTLRARAAAKKKAWERKNK